MFGFRASKIRSWELSPWPVRQTVVQNSQNILILVQRVFSMSPGSWMRVLGVSCESSFASILDVFVNLYAVSYGWSI